MPSWSSRPWLKNLSRKNRSRLAGADADYGYVHLSEFEGVKVGESKRIMVFGSVDELQVGNEVHEDGATHGQQRGRNPP